MKRASVIGSGPNGLAAAIVLAQAGLQVEVFEAEAEPGGAARTLPLTLPGYLHDFGSAVHPFAAGSPFFSALPLADFGLEWIHGEAPLAHPLDDGSAVVLDHDLAKAERLLGLDGREWRRLVEPAVVHWSDFAEDVLAPALRIPNYPFRMASFGMTAFQSANSFARSHFTKPRTRAIFAGLAGHSFLSFDRPLSATIGLLFGITVHAVGWPIPRGGASALSLALVRYLESLGGTVHTSRRIDAAAFRELEADSAVVLFDTATRQLLAIAGERLKPDYRKSLEQFQRGPGVFKVDYALSQPVPWRSADCYRAITVHLGGTIEEIAEAEDAVARGNCAEKPFVLAAQPTLVDPTRAPERKHVLWAYCHVPNGSTFDMSERIEAQIERFAPGFRDCILARHVSTPADLEAADANLLGGDISGGAMTMRQMLFRPTSSGYATSTPNLFLCSSSTPPGGGVHGMCGYHAARLALKKAASNS
ncbi:Protein p49 [Candidatus Sulfotelmatomonas gaucii]|uniref:Protein p49 n=1 Tax=Candidatus Sulfuritelmatomonas gaucii TaxID=2043161 RepID=A0A2N9LY79_9BACT|nr:Protein p49 [Candidatus Sulfotelmatomonas gaucii]